MIKEKYLGVEVCCVNQKSVLCEVENIVEKRKPSFIVAINPEKIMKAQKDTDLLNLLNSADIQIPDGIGVVIASRLKGGNIRNRVTGIDLMQNICKKSSEKGYSIFLLGAKIGVAEKASKILMEKYNGIKIVGVRDGYFKNEDEVVEEIKRVKPDILFVAMGSPKQEYWIKKNIDNLSVPLCMGIGGSLDVICGNIKRAPKWMCSLGLEWLYRLIKEPWRFKRMTVLPVFLFKVIRER
ncbi:N-acetylglucosaminyldiphosphoundecaprenol N-acetyl-beta-D-mannosaminyltransferase [Caloramator quimbayensis]|uniref:N-acetylglucosaminyldiphosphoundecaprenol N-acetyl-beta-D-mannosaminyltransferase n=1 Tax=Caloramator quimbayensis TaxID=1147123 RepID=A0A1T4WTG7_9CLOT|nr:WecB/TagA/CpsF family glycosyltransferase [Caloramator quimbayensis]SKA79901.1 N-acetylglucosaminyldiphosphoundecaprenol N-acetyl-beta-D-mannosaminyltransferase [Caloramator quimbayensis]